MINDTSISKFYEAKFGMKILCPLLVFPFLLHKLKYAVVLKNKKILYKEIKETVWGAKISGDWSTQWKYELLKVE